MVNLVFVAIACVVLFAGYLAFDFFYLKRQRSLKGNTLRVLLFESVGKDKVFKGSFKALEKFDVILGVYITIGKLKKSISGVANTDYFHDVEFGKALAVCKYAEDDYRVMATLKNEVWFKKVEDKKLKKDVYVEYVEPLAIAQSGREAMRFNRAFSKRMIEKRREKANFWDKYGGYIMIGAMLIIILISTAYNSNKWSESSKYMTDKFAEKMDSAIAQTSSPSWVSGLMEQIERRDVESESPIN